MPASCQSWWRIEQRSSRMPGALGACPRTGCSAGALCLRQPRLQATARWQEVGRNSSEFRHRCRRRMSKPQGFRPTILTSEGARGQGADQRSAAHDNDTRRMSKPQGFRPTILASEGARGQGADQRSAAHDNDTSASEVDHKAHCHLRVGETQGLGGCLTRHVVLNIAVDDPPRAGGNLRSLIV